MVQLVVTTELAIFTTWLVLNGFAYIGRAAFRGFRKETNI